MSEIIVSNPLYTPVGVLAASLLKPNAPADDPGALDLFNAEFTAIAAAFNSLYSLGPVVSANTQLTAAAHNVSVDLSPLINADAGVVITLPTSPSVGDPPCLIIVTKAGYHTAASHNEACAIVTSSDQPIDGIDQDNTTYKTQTPLLNIGDLAIATYVGGTEGWHIMYRRTVIANPSVALTLPVLGSFPCAGVEWVVDAASPTYAPVPSTLQAGDRFFVINKTSTITVGDSTYTFNGAAGPRVIAPSYARHEFTCLGGLNFTVAVTG
jgi:hypothetical protein